MRRLRRSVKRKIGSIVMVLLLVVGAGTACGIIATIKTERKYEKRISENNKRPNEAKRLVYITTKEIQKGEKLSEENCRQMYLLSEQAPESLVREREGLVACTYIQAGVILNTALCSVNDFLATERMCILGDIVHAGWFENGMTVDVRIRYPNGENYCVLQRKVIRKTDEEGQEFSVSLSEEEQLLYSSAQYDVDRYNGTILYAVGFLEERLQDDTGNKYIPSEQVYSELQKIKAEGKSSAEWRYLREGLEERLQKFREERESRII